MTTLGLKTHFYLNVNETNSKNEKEIYLQISQGDRKIELTTCLWLEVSMWFEQSQEAKGTSYQAIYTNKQLNELKDRVNNIIRDLESNDIEPTLEIIQFNFLNREEQFTLLNLCDYHIRMLEDNVERTYSKHTIRHHRLVRNKLVEFLKTQPYNGKDIYLHHINYDFVLNFEKFLLEFYKNQRNTINKNMDKLKSIIHSGMKLGWINKDPCFNYKTRFIKPDRKALDIFEIRRIEHLQFIGHKFLDLSKDLFLFMVYTGISFIDVQRLTIDNISMSCGKYILVFERKKSRNPCRVPIIEKAIKIIRKYNHHPDCFEKQMLLPTISINTVNEYLRYIIAKEADISKPLSCHIARYTFTTLVRKIAGLDIEVAKGMLGHTTLEGTSSYTKINFLPAEEYLDKLNEAFV